MRAKGKRSSGAEATPSSARSYRGISGEAREKQRRARLIEAGKEVSSRQGFHGATVADICLTAGLSKRYFYESFEHLAELFEAVYAQANAELTQSLMVALGRSKLVPIVLAEVGLRAFYEFLQQDRARAAILLVVVFQTGQASFKTVKDSAQLLTTLIRALYPDAPERDVDMETLLFGLFSLSVALAASWISDGDSRSVDAMVKVNLIPFVATHEWYIAVKR